MANDIDPVDRAVHQLLLAARVSPPLWDAAKTVENEIDRLRRSERSWADQVRWRTEWMDRAVNVLQEMLRARFIWVDHVPDQIAAMESLVAEEWRESLYDWAIDTWLSDGPTPDEEADRG